MALVKTEHFKFIKGILHQLHSPHPNTPADTEEWKPVEGGDTPSALSDRVGSLETKVQALEAAANAKTPAKTVKPGVLETEVQTGTAAEPAKPGATPAQPTAQPNSPAVTGQ